MSNETRTKLLAVRVTEDAHARMKIIAKHYRMPIAEVARQMMTIGYRPWLDERAVPLK